MTRNDGVPPRIADLDANVVEPRLFPTRRWFAASPLWYYHGPRTGGRTRDDGALRPNRRFYALVDPELRDACRLLLDAGCRTTPSCQGHFYPRAWFAAVWDELRRDLDRITRRGLVVRDSETQRERLFHDRRYRLPWTSFAEFHAAAACGQSRGYLGFVAPERRAALVAALLREDFGGAATVRCGARGAASGGRLVSIEIAPRSIAERGRTWTRVTGRIEALLARAP